MPNALHTTKDGFIVGEAFLAAGRSVKQAVYDGDTVSISPNSYINTRLLGVDTAEMKFTLPGQDSFKAIGGPDWQAFLDDPFDPNLPAFQPLLSPALTAHLQTVIGAGCGANHHTHAKAGEAALQNLIQADVTATRVVSDDQLALFLAFAHDVIDRYGRFLAWLHLDDTVNRPRSYNERLLMSGVAVPYFIWPNIAPFIKEPKVPEPNEPIAGTRLNQSRDDVKNARDNQLGVFEAANPLRLLPFELRYLTRTTQGAVPTRPGPDRWVIDLSAGDDQLRAPHRYIDIANLEDRLFVNAEHVPLFVEHGWMKAE